jgi:hypothetical protein
MPIENDFVACMVSVHEGIGRREESLFLFSLARPHGCRCGSRGNIPSLVMGAPYFYWDTFRFSESVN